MSAVYASSDLAANVSTAVFTPSALSASVTLSLCNRNSSSVSVRVALSTTPSPTDADWLEYNTTLPPFGVLERTGLVIKPAHHLVVSASAVGVSAVVFGYE
jgi:hypothetical protein